MLDNLFDKLKATYSEYEYIVFRATTPEIRKSTIDLIKKRSTYYCSDYLASVSAHGITICTSGRHSIYTTGIENYDYESCPTVIDRHIVLPYSLPQMLGQLHKPIKVSK